MLVALKKLLGSLQAPKPPARAADIEVCAHGIRKVLTAPPQDFSWKELVSIQLAWSENPWGDPWFGPYCDTEWVIKSSSGRVMHLFDDEGNRQIALPAFARYLENFSFDYAAFDQQHAKRISDLDGGEVLVWNRHT